MNINSSFKRICMNASNLKRLRIALLLTVAVAAASTHAVNLTPLPPYLSEIKGAPMVMLNLSRDHQLFYKAYNEYSDLDGDGVIETQYKHSYKYYGYFDNERCYEYSSDNRYVPVSKAATDGYCNVSATNQWNGNFMNWATMTRADVVRRILYGGFRSTDDSLSSGTSLTVLERAHLPTDAHAFAKYYSGADISKLTPFSTTQLTLCNASFGNGTAPANNSTDAPSILVADGNHALWNANERWQCYWSETKSASNGNNPALTGLNASSSNPSRATQGLGTGYAKGSYTARVEVCKTGLTGGFTDDEDARCKLYPLGNYKPVGLLQKYGEKNEAAFGLMTGTFDKNISGGVLRKNVASFTDEVDIDDGQFKNVNGIVRTINRLKIYGYNYVDGTYLADGAGCNYQQIGLVDGECASWGNPVGELYLESLRYLAGKTASTAFTPTVALKEATLGLSITAWSDPFAASTVPAFGDQLCRRSSVINFNASVTSFDQDQWAGASDIKDLTPALVDDYTNLIGNAEGLYATGKLWAIGRNGVDNNGFCSDKALTASGTTSFANANGVCPEAPTQYGGYKMAGAALYAHTKPIRGDFTIPSNNTRAFKVDTYSVALATGTPRIQVPVPGQPGKFVLISPAYRLSVGGGGGGTLVDFKVISQTPTAGKYLVNWEDSEQGGDFDQDVLGILEYSVSGSTISVKTYAAAQATVNGQGFGYAISGTNGKDGVHFHSGVLGFNYTDPRNITVTPTTKTNASGGCANCQVAEAATTATYSMVGVSSDVLKDPLFYAAKYGNFDRDKASGYVPGTALPVEAWDAKTASGLTGTDGIPDSYFYAVDPAQLERSLEQVFSTILKAGGAAPAAATSSRTQVANFVYVSTHSIKAAGGGADADASGEFLRYGFQTNGSVNTSPDWDGGTKLTVQNWDTGRNILTQTGKSGVSFRWTNLDSAQRTALRINPQTGTTNSNATGQNRLNWLRGDNTNETTSGGLRARPKTKLGAIINSTPWYVGRPSAGYSNLQYGGGYSAFVTDNSATNAVFVAANDGMVHSFDGTSGAELFAYVPRALYSTSTVAPYSKLSSITAKDFSLNTGISGINADGSVMAADMKVGSPSTWATYLFGALGRGARGVYALNITKPQEVNETAAKAAAVVKWEFTDDDDVDMGYITGRTNTRNNGQPSQTGYMANGKWAAIYGNGYNSLTGKAALFILFAAGPSGSGGTWIAGTDYVKLTVGVAGDGPENGLATPTAVDVNNDGTIDRIYAGDLKGNVWKFDVSGTNPSSWGVATTGSAPIYQARTTRPSAPTTQIFQPITTAIQPFAHPDGGLQLVFGTGKSLESIDYPMSAPYTNTMYGIRDLVTSTAVITTGRTDLVQQTVSFVGSSRYITQNAVDYTTKKGWYVDLPDSSEGVVFNPLAEDSRRVLIRSLAPEGVNDGCRVDTFAYDMTLDVIRGNAIERSIPGAPAVTGLGATGGRTLNSFEFARGGAPTRSTRQVGSGATGASGVGVSDTSCVAGSSADCKCNPASPTQCAYDDPNDDKPFCPIWDTKACDALCSYPTNAALGNGGISSAVTLGACTNGRLTWREVLRNR
jgi:type IV pilus assembly protein PilY1